MNWIEYLIGLYLQSSNAVFSFLQYINETGFRACVKELFVNQHDPLSVSYAIMPGRIEKQDHFDLYLLKCFLCCYS